MCFGFALCGVAGSLCCALLSLQCCQAPQILLLSSENTENTALVR